MVVPSDFASLSPAEQIRIAGESIDQHYGEITTEQSRGGRYLPQLLKLQRDWGVSPPQGFEWQWPDEEAPPATPPGPESRILQPAGQPVQLTLGSPTATTIATGPRESTIEHWFDMLGRAEQGIPSQREGDIGVPRFDPFDPGRGYPIRQFPVDPRKTPMPQVPPGRLPQPPNAATIAARG
jgi:hypothetical protein